MQDQVVGNRLIAKNATMLYLRMFVTLAISFYTSRIVLKALGVSDYGIYNVVGGVIVMISTLTGALGGATSRFLTFSLGKKDLDNLKLTFSTAFYIHLSLAVLFVVVAESIGVWFVNTQLVIPEGRMGAANWVFQAAILSTALGMTQTPYSASITSHERMGAFAYIAIANSILKLAIAFVVLYSLMDHLVLYSILLMALSIGFQLYYRYYCIRNFAECSLMLRFDKGLFKQMLSFSGWSMVGGLSLMAWQQGVNILINRFFGTLINAAVGVAGQVQGILYSFTGNINAAFNPQIIKSYAIGDYQRFNYLIGMGSKFSVLITILTTIPLYFNIDFLMSVWLEEVPAGAPILFQILIFRNFFNSFNPYLYTGISASGKIRWKNIASVILYTSFLVGTYIVLKLTHSYTLAFVFGVLCSPTDTVICAFILRKQVREYALGTFFLHTYLPMAIVAGLSFSLAWAIHHLEMNPWISFVLTVAVCSSFVIYAVLYWILDAYSRHVLIDYVKKKVNL
jgi:O-antigen/teichoic acid export membrane protein